MFKTFNLKKFLVCLLIPFGAAFLSWLLTKNQMDIYSEIKNPPLSPPSFLFGIVWSVLYFLMGVSLYLVRMSSAPQQLKSLGYMIFGLQLAFNFAWTIIFFDFRAFNFAVVWLIMLIALIAANIYVFFKISKPAAYLLVPYLLWSLFALYLTAGIAILN